MTDISQATMICKAIGDAYGVTPASQEAAMVDISKGIERLKEWKMVGSIEGNVGEVARCAFLATSSGMDRDALYELFCTDKYGMVKYFVDGFSDNIQMEEEFDEIIAQIAIRFGVCLISEDGKITDAISALMRNAFEFFSEGLIEKTLSGSMGIIMSGIRRFFDDVDDPSALSIVDRLMRKYFTAYEKVFGDAGNVKTDPPLEEYVRKADSIMEKAAATSLVVASVKSYIKMNYDGFERAKAFWDEIGGETQMGGFSDLFNETKNESKKVDILKRFSLFKSPFNPDLRKNLN